MPNGEGGFQIPDVPGRPTMQQPRGGGGGGSKSWRWRKGGRSHAGVSKEVFFYYQKQKFETEAD